MEADWLGKIFAKYYLIVFKERSSNCAKSRNVSYVGYFPLTINVIFKDSDQDFSDFWSL